MNAFQRLSVSVVTVALATCPMLGLLGCPATSAGVRNVENDACSAMLTAGQLALADLSLRGTVSKTEVAVADELLSQAVALCKQRVGTGVKDAGKSE
jgi:hypothetical protein